MSPDSPWVIFWQVVLVVGLGSYFLLALVVIPLGARDIKRLFTKLEETVDKPEEDDRGVTLP